VSVLRRQVSEAHSGPLVAVAFAPDASDKFATASADCTLRVWDAADYGALATVQVCEVAQPTQTAPVCVFLVSIINARRAPVCVFLF
jgi:WD40 repeat protein